MYEPAEDSYLLTRVIPRYVKGKSFLDMGTGSGIQAETAQKAGAASIVAVDIDKEVQNHIMQKNILFIRSNLFTHVKGRFDVIAFNPPYLPRDEREDKKSQRVTTGGKKGDEIICRFLRTLPVHMAQGGVCLLLLSSLTPRERINALLEKKRLCSRVVAKQPLFMESLEVWELVRSQ